ncbi:lipoprotein insertase outer membrane protein LolB [Vibrio sp. HN007]|uniref:lipoprotein insertase outer membrane protein LolB n=1 Tax=Vibrio iocasae TaxID=3098914 RepID=UPI0035D43021
MKTLYRFFLSIVPLILLTACESIPEQSTKSVEWQNHEGLLSQIDTYRASGKLGYKSPDVTQSLNFTWNHSPEKSQLRLTTFLGKTVLNITMTPEGATVVDIDGNEYQDKNATLLVYRLTGLVIPVTYMQDWLKGLPTSTDSFDLNEETNTLQSLSKKLGTKIWNLNYESYQAVGSIPLPYMMKMTQDQTSLKIVVSKWII